MASCAEARPRPFTHPLVALLAGVSLVTLPTSSAMADPDIGAAEAMSSEPGPAWCGFSQTSGQWYRNCHNDVSQPWPWPGEPDTPVPVTMPWSRYTTFSGGQFRISLTGNGQLWFSVGTQAMQQCPTYNGATVCDVSLSWLNYINLEVRKPSGNAYVFVSNCQVSPSACL